MSKLLVEFFDAFLFCGADQIIRDVVDLRLGGGRVQSFFEIRFPLFSPWRQPFLVVDDCPLECMDSSDNIGGVCFKGR